MGQERPLLLVRLRVRQPDGSTVGESRRVCHIVLVPEVHTEPEFLTTCCGLRIGPGAGEVVPRVAGMPCEPCMARSRISAFSMLASFGRLLEDGNGEF